MTRARIIGVSGASGGVGASCLVAALGVRGSRRGLACVCVDLRRYAGGLDVVFGADHERAVRWGQLTRARGHLDIPELLRHLPRGDGVPLVSHDRDDAAPPDPAAIAAVVEGLAAHVDLVIIDLPRPAEADFADAVALLHEGLIVCGSGPTQLAAAGAHARVLGEQAVSWSVVQRMDRHSAAHLPTLVCEALGLPVLALLPDDDRVTADLRRGRAPGSRGALAHTADLVLDATLQPLRRSA